MGELTAIGADLVGNGFGLVFRQFRPYSRLAVPQRGVLLDECNKVVDINFTTCRHDEKT